MVDTMPLAEVLELRSGDHGGRVGGFPYSPRRRYDDPEEWDWTDWDYKHVDDIAASMEANGWAGPPVCVRDGVLKNGHHRTIAAYMVGITDIPVTSEWAESEDR